MSDLKALFSSDYHPYEAAVVDLARRPETFRTSISSDVLTLQTATPTRLVADSSCTKKTRNESGKSPFRCVALPRARAKWNIDFVIRYVADDQSSLAVSETWRKETLGFYFIASETDIQTLWSAFWWQALHCTSQTLYWKKNSFLCRHSSLQKNPRERSCYYSLNSIGGANENNTISLFLPNFKYGSWKRLIFEIICIFINFYFFFFVRD